MTSTALIIDQISSHPCVALSPSVQYLVTPHHYPREASLSETLHQTLAYKESTCCTNHSIQITKNSPISYVLEMIHTVCIVTISSIILRIFSQTISNQAYSLLPLINQADSMRICWAREPIRRFHSGRHQWGRCQIRSSSQ